MLNFLPTSPLFLSGTATIHLLPNDKFICVRINLVKRCRWLNRSRGHMISLENSTSCSYILFVFVSIKDYTLTYCLSFEKYSLKISSSDCKIEYYNQTAQSIFSREKCYCIRCCSLLNWNSKILFVSYAYKKYIYLRNS